MAYLSEGLSELATAIERSSNTMQPLAELAVLSALLTESIESGLEEQTEDIVSKLKK